MPTATDPSQPTTVPDPMPGSETPPRGDDFWFDQRPAGEPKAPKRTLSLRAKVGAGVLVAALGVGSVVGISVASSKLSSANASTAAAGAQGAMGGGPGAGGGPGGSGTIASISGSNLTVTGQDGTTTSVVTSGSTTVSKVVTGSISDLKVGDNVTVMGATAESGVTAQRIIDTGSVAVTDGGGPGGGGPPGGQTNAAANASGSAQAGNGQAPPGGGAGMGMTRGTIASLDGSNITVTAADGTTTSVTTSSSTTVSIEQASTLSALATGDTVRVIGQTGTDGTVTATRIVQGADLGGPGGGGAPAAAN